MINDLFRKIAARISMLMGSPYAFMAAVGIIVGWSLSGRYFDYSDTWQLVINTGTTIVTFLMVFLIQNTQNRDSKAIHLKLDELVRAEDGARNAFVDVEDLTDEQLDLLQKDFEILHRRGSSHILKDLHRRTLAEHAKRRGHSFLKDSTDALVASYKDFEAAQDTNPKRKIKNQNCNAKLNN